MSQSFGGKSSRGSRYPWRGRRGNYGGRGNHSNKPYNASKQGGPSSSHSQTSNEHTRGHNNRPQPTSTSTCPYKKWSTYFLDDAYNQNSDFAAKVTKLYQYFKANLSQFDKEVIEEQEVVYLDYQALVSDPDLIEEIPTLASDIKNEPSRFLPAISLSLHEAFLNDEFKEGSSSVSRMFFDVAYINIRLFNVEPVIALKSLKASYFGKLVTIRGTVVRVGNIKPILKKMAFSCNSCGEEQVINVPDGKFIVPTSCDSFNCRGRSFAPLRCSPKTETVNWQVIKIQEMILDDQREAGRIPRNIECELTCGLVDSCIPGDMVTITGVVKASSSDENPGRSKDRVMYLLYIHAVSVNNSKEVNDGKEHESSEFSIKDLYAIQEIQSEENLFRLITGSLCPTIYGHELVKAGMSLALFGGSKKSVDEKNALPIRSDPHVLVVGDPGLGKSQLLQAVANIAPRGVYVCGNTATTSGLTVTLTKESGTGDYALEAGALVLADKGCCCIDEFDKMSSQHNALLEAMEQQSISIAKAGIVCSLPARTSIIAAANPVGGHYNKAKTVSENLRMNSALLSRFDLVFILLDKPDEEIDGILSEHVMGLHSEKTRTPKVTSVTVERNPTTKQIEEKRGNIWDSENALSTRLKLDRRESFDPIPSQLLRKYVQYARKYVHPKLSSEAAKVLKEFYMTLRKQRHGPDSTPITTRQLEAMLRLTEARARLELREKATEQDAKDIVEIMKNSLIDTFTNEYGGLDFDRSIHGSGMSKRNQCKKFIAELNRVSDRENNPMFTVEQMYRIANQLQLGISNFDDFIMNLNHQNFLLKKGTRLYQLQTASCL